MAGMKGRSGGARNGSGPKKRQPSPVLVARSPPCLSSKVKGKRRATDQGDSVQTQAARTVFGVRSTSGATALLFCNNLSTLQASTSSTSTSSHTPDLNKQDNGEEEDLDREGAEGEGSRIP